MKQNEIIRYLSDTGVLNVEKLRGMNCFTEEDLDQVVQLIEVNFAKGYKKKHPIQPLSLDEHGTLRFKANGIISHLFDTKELDLNSLSAMRCFSYNDWVQLAQLLGYSLGGFGDLSYVSDEDYDAAEELWEKRKINGDKP